MAVSEAQLKKMLSKYKYRDLSVREIVNVTSLYRDLKPLLDFYVFNDGTSRELLSLTGTIPVPYKGNTYNIPICLWLLDTYPYNPPICFVKPTSTMTIKTGKHVDANGKIYLPYLHEWKHPPSDLLGLIQILVVVFGEEPPVFSRSSAPATYMYPATGPPNTPECQRKASPKRWHQETGTEEAEASHVPRAPPLPQSLAPLHLPLPGLVTYSTGEDEEEEDEEEDDDDNTTLTPVEHTPHVPPPQQPQPPPPRPQPNILNAEEISISLHHLQEHHQAFVEHQTSQLDCIGRQMQRMNRTMEVAQGTRARMALHINNRLQELTQATQERTEVARDQLQATREYTQAIREQTQMFVALQRELMAQRAGREGPSTTTASSLLFGTQSDSSVTPTRHGGRRRGRGASRGRGAFSSQ
ncbi:tumor susceptibility gene 101 protein isoform X1 [Pseudophryne corroboree]|uniref:tumor susceptibility gene 101 protein isoform X1 n=1 Tax=Pseudophryne corroboree TaxID=495146 RepID=UPI0030819F26